MNQSELREKFEPLVNAYPRPQAALVPLLHSLVDAGNGIADELVQPVADLCNVSPESVRSLIDAYQLSGPTPRSDVSVCLGLICYINGGKSVYERLKRDPSIVGADDAVVTTTPCVGHCYAAPVLCLGDEGFFRACVDNLP